MRQATDRSDRAALLARTAGVARRIGLLLAGLVLLFQATGLQAAPDDKARARALVDEAQALMAEPARRTEALQKFREAVALDPGEPGNGLALGEALNATGRHEEAIVALQAAIAIAPRFGAAYLEWGKALMALGRLDEAVTRFEAAAPVMGDDPGLYADWCAALQTLGREAEAAPICARAEQ